MQINFDNDDPNKAVQAAKLKTFKNELARDYFLDGIHAEIKDKLDWMSDPPTLEEAVALAKRIEERLKRNEMTNSQREESARAELALAKVNAVSDEIAAIRESFSSNQQNRTNWP